MVFISRILCIFIAGLMLLTAGCALKSREDQYKTLPFSDPQAAYALALELHDGERYEKAADIFLRLAETGPTQDLRRKALFGLAATRLVMARNQDEYDIGLSLWRDWEEKAPDSALQQEDPRLLYSLLTRVIYPEEDGDPRFRNELEKEIEDLKSDKIRNARRLETLQKRVNDLSKDNARLKEQLQALEELHKEIELKKRRLSNE